MHYSHFCSLNVSGVSTVSSWRGPEDVFLFSLRHITIILPTAKVLGLVQLLALLQIILNISADFRICKPPVNLRLISSLIYRPTAYLQIYRNVCIHAYHSYLCIYILFTYLVVCLHIKLFLETRAQSCKFAEF